MKFLKHLLISALFLIGGASVAFGQQYYYCGQNVMVDSCKNEVTGFLQGGDNTNFGFFMGPSFGYKRHLTDRWYVGGAFDLSFGKKRYGFYGQGGYRLPAGKWFNFFFQAKIMYNRYSRYETNEWATAIMAIWEGWHFSVHVGSAIVGFTHRGDAHTEKPVFVFGAAGHIRPRTNSWNIGLFFRNYDEFYFENWQINWGLNWYASLAKNLKMYGELNIRPAGSLSQLATKYETSLKAGVRYTW